VPTKEENEALVLVDRVVSAYSGTRQDHAALLRAVSIIKAGLLRPEPKAEPKPKSQTKK